MNTKCYYNSNNNNKKAPAVRAPLGSEPWHKSRQLARKSSTVSCSISQACSGHQDQGHTRSGSHTGQHPLPYTSWSSNASKPSKFLLSSNLTLNRWRNNRFQLFHAIIDLHMRPCINSNPSRCISFNLQWKTMTRLSHVGPSVLVCPVSKGKTKRTRHPLVINFTASRPRARSEQSGKSSKGLL